MSDYMMSKPEINHHCHWPGCGTQVPPKLWGCKKHWYMLPESLRNAIWREYVPGQEVSKNPSRAYVAVARQAREWILQTFPLENLTDDQG